MDSSSLISTNAKITDCAETAGKMREFANGYNHQQPGGPGKLAVALIELANSNDPPLRLQLGTNALMRIAEKNAYAQREAEQKRTLVSSMDF